jgi:hypothetical protein
VATQNAKLYQEITKKVNSNHIKLSLLKKLKINKFVYCRS